MNGDTTPRAWRKSSYSSGNDNCVEIATDADAVIAVRDSKNPAGPVLQISTHRWRLFLGGLRDGEFDPT